MNKSTTRFNTPKRWAAAGPRTMRAEKTGGYITHSDYLTLLRAYNRALFQLQRAGQLVATLKQEARC